MIMVIGGAHKATDYMQAGRVRGRMMGHLERAFQACDVLVTPTCAITAPAIRCAVKNWPGQAAIPTDVGEQPLPQGVHGLCAALSVSAWAVVTAACISPVSSVLQLGTVRRTVCSFHRCRSTACQPASSAGMAALNSAVGCAQGLGWLPVEYNLNVRLPEQHHASAHNLKGCLPCSWPRKHRLDLPPRSAVATAALCGAPSLHTLGLVPIDRLSELLGSCASSLNKMTGQMNPHLLPQTCSQPSSPCQRDSWAAAIPPLGLHEHLPLAAYTQPLDTGLNVCLQLLISLIGLPGPDLEA